MEKQEFIDFLVSRNWATKPASDLFHTSIIDSDMELSDWRASFVGAFCTSYNHERVHIIRGIASVLRVNVPQWSDFSKANVALIREDLLSKCSANTAKTYLAMLRSVFATYSDAGVLPSNSYKKEMRVRKEPSQHIALTEEEIELIHKYQPKSETESDVKRDFMIEALCGARSSDVKSLTEDNIVGGWLTYVSQKTKTETKVPVHKYLTEYIRQPRHGEHNRSCCNKVIQRICQNVGINDEIKLFVAGRWQTKPKYQFCGTHTGRRSFATCLAVRGVPVAVISKMMGHASVNQTSHYITFDVQQISDSALSFFN